MVNIFSTTLGLYPLPDWVKSELSELKGHQREGLISGNENSLVNSIYDSAREFIIGEQQNAGLDLIVEGQLRWDDMLAHPLSVHESTETRGLVRYYDNNNFYRDVVVKGELSSNGDIGDELKKTKGLIEFPHAIIPGVYTLSKLVTDEYYGSSEKFIEAIGEFLAYEIDQFPTFKYLTMLEPSLVFDPPEKNQIKIISEILDKINSKVSGEMIIQTYWGSIGEEMYENILDLDIGIGYDFVNSSEKNIDLMNEFGTPKTITLGVVNGQNTSIESVDKIKETIGKVDDYKEGIENLLISPNTELFYLPESVFIEKLKVLGLAANEEMDL
jgi:5-methyltetrahydropteroyltriglutamate--homocysteine methyltransferase